MDTFTGNFYKEGQQQPLFIHNIPLPHFSAQICRYLIIGNWMQDIFTLLVAFFSNWKFATFSNFCSCEYFNYVANLVRQSEIIMRCCQFWIIVENNAIMLPILYCDCARCFDNQILYCSCEYCGNDGDFVLRSRILPCFAVQLQIYFQPLPDMYSSCELRKFSNSYVSNFDNLLVSNIANFVAANIAKCCQFCSWACEHCLFGSCNYTVVHL